MSKKRRPAPAAASASFPVPAKVALAALLLAHVVLGLVFIRSASPTYDESVHLASGYSYWKTGRYRMNIMDHPPLAEMWAAVPLLALQPSLLTGRPDWLDMRLYHYSDAFLFQNIVPGEKMMNAGRTFLFMTLSAVLLAGLLSWAFRLGGAAAVVGTAGAAAFCPVLLTNLAIAGTDGTSAVFFFLVFRLLAGEERNRSHWAGAGLCFGLALAAKFNMIILFPLVGGMLLLDHRLRGSGKFPWDQVGLAGACAMGALASVYRFVHVPLYWAGLTATLTRLGGGRSAFFLGAHSVTGFWFYFPVALAVKTPLPMLAAAAWGTWGCLSSAKRERLWVALPMLGYFAVAMTAKVQIGVRHLLPMMPFLILAAGCCAGALWEQGGRRRWLAAGAGLWLVLSVLRVQPYSLAYFNELVGGPPRGHEWFVDSNLDWGQDLKTLAQEVRARGNPPIYLAYFGSADPSAYGLRYVPLGMCCNVTRPDSGLDPAASGRVLFAVSATNLQAVYFQDKTIFSWLKKRSPDKVLGHSIYLYDLTEDREGRAILAELVKGFTRDPVIRTSRVNTLLLQ